MAQNQEDALTNALGPHLNIVGARHSQVLLEVAMVPEDLLSRFGGFFVSREVDLGGGRQIVFIPARRGSTEEDAILEFE